MPKRVTVTLRDPDVKRLNEVSDSTELSQNDAIRKALATESFIQRTLADGGKILVESETGEIREVEFVT